MFTSHFTYIFGAGVVTCEADPQFDTLPRSGSWAQPSTLQRITQSNSLQGTMGLFIARSLRPEDIPIMRLVLDVSPSLTNDI